MGIPHIESVGAPSIWYPARGGIIVIQVSLVAQLCLASRFGLVSLLGIVSIGCLFALVSIVGLVSLYLHRLATDVTILSDISLSCRIEGS